MGSKQPQGRVRGTLNAFATLKGKERSIASIILTLDGDRSVSIDLPSRLSINDLADVREALAQFERRFVELTS